MAVGLPQHYALKVSKAARADIDEIAGGCVQTKADLLAYLHELGQDQALLSNMLTHGYGKRKGDWETHSIGVGSISLFWNGRPRRDIWTLKFWPLESRGRSLRFLYVYLPSERWFVVLAVVRRSWNYADNDPLTDRIRDDYDRIVKEYG